MSKAEKFIQENTKKCSNEIIGGGWNNGEFVQIFNPWLTPDQALEAVKIVREEMFEKAIGWIGEIYNYHEIIRFSDSCESSLEELIEWFKNYIKEGGKDE